MARKGSVPNGRTRLDEAMATLIQNQAALVVRLTENDRIRAELERRHLEYEHETAERFARIEARMTEIIRILNEHNRILEEHNRGSISLRKPSAKGSASNHSRDQ